MKIIIIPILLFLVSCSSNSQYSKFSFQDPAQSVSIPFPKASDYEDKIVVFKAILDPGLWSEVIAGGGVWPILSLDSSNKISRGYAFLNGVDYFGNFLLYGALRGNKEDSKIIYLNRDGSWAYSLLGKEIDGYNFQKFEKDEDYQRKIFSSGTTLSELDKFWKKEHSVNSYRKLTLEEYKSFIKENMKFHYKTPQGIYSSYLPLDEFRKIAVSLPGFNSKERFIEKAKIPIIAFPFMGAGLLTMSALSLTSDILTASIDDDLSGFYGQAKVKRYQLAPEFRKVSEIYKRLLEIRDKKIEELEFEIHVQEIIRRQQWQQ